MYVKGGRHGKEQTVYEGFHAFGPGPGLFAGGQLRAEVCAVHVRAGAERLGGAVCGTAGCGGAPGDTAHALRRRAGGQVRQEKAHGRAGRGLRRGGAPGGGSALALRRAGPGGGAAHCPIRARRF